MKPRRDASRFPCTSLLVLAAGFLVSLEGCKHGGGSRPGAGAAGSVTVLIADSPADDLEHVFVDITRVSLVPPGSGSSTVVFEGKERVDLLSLRDADLVLAKRDVPRGRFEKIRIELENVEVEPNPDDLEVEVQEGQVDIDADEPFEVDDARPLFVRIDIDAGKSTSIHETGGHQTKIEFRAVCSVGVHEGRAPRECHREIAGVIKAIDKNDVQDEHEHADDNEAEGPEDATADKGGGSSADSGGEDLVELVVDLGADRGTVRVEVQTSTVIIGADALKADLTALHVGDAVRARGGLEDDAELEATWVMVGTPLDVRGAFQSGVTEGKFTFLAEGATEAREGRATAATLAFADCHDTPLGLSQIAAGRRARILGADAKDNGTEVIRAAVIDVQPSRVKGKITAVDQTQGKITLLPASGPEVQIRFDDRTVIALVGDGVLQAGDLQVGQTAIAELEKDGDRAVKIAVVPERASGTASEVDAAAGAFILKSAGTPEVDTKVKVASGATVLLVQGHDLRRAALGELKAGDQVTVFGLAGTGGTFVAHALVIRR